MNSGAHPASVPVNTVLETQTVVLTSPLPLEGVPLLLLLLGRCLSYENQLPSVIAAARFKHSNSWLLSCAPGQASLLL